jgi:hypothetical protein
MKERIPYYCWQSLPAGKDPENLLTIPAMESGCVGGPMMIGPRLPAGPCWCVDDRHVEVTRLTEVARKSTPTQQERRNLFDLTGNRFTALHHLPGWHTSTSSPLDAMHLLYLGAMNWIVKQILVGPGMLSKPQPTANDPQEIFNNCLERMWMPKNFSGVTESGEIHPPISPGYDMKIIA